MNRFVEDLTVDMHSMLVDADDHNVDLTIGEHPNTRRFKAHSHMLRARSPYFSRALSAKWAKKDGDTYVYKKPNVQPDVFDFILKFIYTGMIDFDKEDGETILKVLVIADELELVTLVDYSQEYLISHKPRWLCRKLVEVMHTAEKHDRFAKLKSYCSDTIANRPRLVIEASDFPALEESVLVSLLQRDDLNIVEIEIWNNLIRWGVARTPALGQKQLIEYTNDDFAELKKSLQTCIEHVRFYQISSEDYCDKVMPYEKILPADTNTQLLRYHLKPNAIPPAGALPPRLLIDSVIIRPAHAILIGLWIAGKNDTVIAGAQPLYEFELLFRASRDGYAASAFHKKCDHVYDTVVVVRVSKTDKIVGGYNSDNWEPFSGKSGATNYGKPSTYNHSKYSENIFTFSFQSEKDVRYGTLARNDDSGRVSKNRLKGPYFKDDLFIANNCNENRDSWYQNYNFSDEIMNDPDESTHYFQVDDYEVFAVTKIKNRR